MHKHLKLIKSLRMSEGKEILQIKVSGRAWGLWKKGHGEILKSISTGCRDEFGKVKKIPIIIDKTIPPGKIKFQLKGEGWYTVDLL